MMTFTEAAAEVLRQVGKPLHYKEITELAIEKNLLSHVGKSPEVTMGARLAALIKKEDKANPIVRVKPGVFALRDWSEKKLSKGAAAVEDPAEAEDADVEVNALEALAMADVQRNARTEAGDVEASEAAPVDHGFRADLAASGADLFDDEDDDDEPILGPESEPAPAPGAEVLGDGTRRRRRRRRRGGRGGADNVVSLDGPSAVRGEFRPGEGRAGEGRAGEGRAGEGRGGDGRNGEGRPAVPPATSSGALPREGGREYRGGDMGLPGFAESPFSPIVGAGIGADDREVAREGGVPRPMVRDRRDILAAGPPTGIELPVGEGDELSGRDLADAAAVVLASFDRASGAAPMRSIADVLLRRGRLAGDANAATTQVSAAVRADNLRRASQGQRPRFRLAAGARVGLTDWLVGPDLTRLEADVASAIERYREAARRTMLRRVQELPGHAFVELALLVLERAGMQQFRAVRRPGSPGGELHFAAAHRTGTDEVRTAIVLRRDGREIGRERVTDLRGALHHYGNATAGWILTTGQVLSGAREEAGALTSQPVTLFDGYAFCRLLEEYDVGVMKTRFSIALPDLELFDALRGN